MTRAEIAATAAALVLGTSCITDSMVVVGMPVPDTAGPQVTSEDPLGDVDLAELLTEIQVCADTQAVLFDPERTFALYLSVPGAGQAAYADQITTTYGWEEDEDEERADTRLWRGTAMDLDDCSGDGAEFSYQVEQGTLTLKVSPTELDLDADGAAPIRATVNAERVGFDALDGGDEDVWISELELSWQGSVAPY